MTSPIFIDLVCGGMAGALSWLSIMPFDVLKSKIQADIEKKLSMKQTFVRIWQTEGLGGFYRGSLPTFIRGFIVNAVIFCTYMQTLKFLEKI